MFLLLLLFLCLLYLFELYVFMLSVFDASLLLIYYGQPALLSKLAFWAAHHCVASLCIILL